MTEESNTAVETAIPDVDTDNTNTEALQTNETLLTTEAEAVTETETQATEATDTETNDTDADQYEWVPKKYWKDGKPDLESFKNGFENMEKMLGKKGLLKPDSVEEYDAQPEFPQGWSVDEQATNQFKAEALEQGFTPDQYKFIMQKYSENISKSVVTPETAQQILTEEWGKQDFASNLSAAQAAFEAYAPSNIDRNDPIFNNPTVLKILARVGSELSEDQRPAQGTKQAAQSRQDIEAMMASPEYRDPNSDTYKTVVKWFENTYN